MAGRYTPKKIYLEASSYCQLRCPSCPTTSGEIHPAVGSGFLKLADFRKLVDDNPWVTDIELSNYGEIFLNPDLLEIMAYAHGRGVKLSAFNGVNLNHAKDDVLEGLVKYGFRGMTCSIDGASAESYRRYRVRGSFDKVVKNIRKINKFKELYDSKLPILTWQFVLFGHNEHEIVDARTMAQALNMKFELKLSWDDDISPVRDKANLARTTGLTVTTREEFRRLFGRMYKADICLQLWTSPVINWDGKVLGCCRNFWGDFGGNAFTDGLANSLNNEKIAYARDMLLGKKPMRDGIPCTTCEMYLDLKKRGKFFKETIRPAKESTGTDG